MPPSWKLRQDGGACGLSSALPPSSHRRVGDVVMSSRSRHLNPEVRLPSAGVLAWLLGWHRAEPSRAGGGEMAAAAELQGKYQKLAQEYSKVSGARARPRCSASGGRRPPDGAAPLQPFPARGLPAVTCLTAASLRGQRSARGAARPCLGAGLVSAEMLVFVAA